MPFELAVVEGSPAILDTNDARRVPITDQEWGIIERAHVFFKITMNMFRAYSWLSEARSDFVIVLEDDLDFADRWLERAIDVACHLNLARNDACLSLTTGVHDDAFERHAEAWKFRNPLDFWGQQALMWKWSDGTRVREHLRAIVNAWKPEQIASGGGDDVGRHLPGSG